MTEKKEKHVKLDSEHAPAVVRSIRDYDRLVRGGKPEIATDPTSVGRRAADAILRDVREVFRASST